MRVCFSKYRHLLIKNTAPKICPNLYRLETDVCVFPREAAHSLKREASPEMRYFGYVNCINTNNINMNT